MDVIYQQINAFRQDPFLFNLSCSPPPFFLTELQVDSGLENASLWQSLHICDPIDHTTCKTECHVFPNHKCDYITRIQYFQPHATEISELLVKGPKRPVRHLIEKHSHCLHLLDPTINSMGAAIMANLFILALAWIDPK